MVYHHKHFGAYVKTLNCIVTKCNSSSKKQATKIFLPVPKDKERRKQWLQVVGYKYAVSEKTNLYVCEDHFNLKEDLANYLQVKLMGYQKKLKPHVIPHKFECRNKPSISETKLVKTEIQNSEQSTKEIFQIITKEACKDSTNELLLADNIDIKEEFVELTEDNINYESKPHNLNLLEFDHKIHNDVQNIEVCVKKEHFIDKCNQNNYNELLNTTECETTNSTQLEIENLHEKQEIDNKIEFVEVSNNSDTNFYNESLHIDSSSNKSVFENIDNEWCRRGYRPTESKWKCKICKKIYRYEGNFQRHINNSIPCLPPELQDKIIPSLPYRAKKKTNQYVPPSIAPKLPAPSQPLYQFIVVENQ